jgi:hypothetical protein
MTYMHTLSAGESVTAKYGSFGATGKVHFNTPLNSVVIYCGLPKQGKSRFIQGYPGSFIINTDLGPQYHPHCQMWPHMSDNPDMPGPINADGVPISFTWESVREVEAKLLEAAKLKKPRPRVIHIDSLTTAYLMVQQWVAEKLGFKSFGDVTESRRAYDAAYSEIVRFIDTLKKAGYGVGVIVHLTYISIPVDDGKTTQKLDVALTDGLYKRLFPLADLMIGVSSYEFSKPVTKTVKLADGKTITKQATESVPLLRLQCTQSGLEKVYGRRVQLPESFDVPNDSTSFVEFLKTYDQCVAQTVLATQSTGTP